MSTRKRIAVIGSGPSAQSGIPMALRVADAIVTCNAGILAIPHERIDAYAVGDPVAIEKWGDAIRAYADQGGRIVQGRLRGEDQVTPPLMIGEEHRYYDRADVSYHGRTAGVLATRVALEMGATDLMMVGMDGYPDDHTEGDHAAAWARRINMIAAIAIHRLRGEYSDANWHWIGGSVLMRPGCSRIEFQYHNEPAAPDLDIAIGEGAIVGDYAEFENNPVGLSKGVASSVRTMSEMLKGA